MGDERERSGGSGIWHAEKKTVLLAEAEENTRNQTRGLLEDAGYAVIVTDNGYSSLSVLQEFGDCIDVFLMDLNMPVMDGDWVLREMKNRRHDIPVIIFSGIDEGEIRKRCKGCRISGILPKPSPAGDILEMLSGILPGLEKNSRASWNAAFDGA